MDHYIFVYDTSRELYILARALLVTVLRGVWGVTAVGVVIVMALFVAWVLLLMAELIDRGHGLEFLLLGYTYA